MAMTQSVQDFIVGDYVVYLRDGTELTLSRRYRDRLAPLMGGL